MNPSMRKFSHQVKKPALNKEFFVINTYQIQGKRNAPDVGVTTKLKVTINGDFFLILLFKQYIYLYQLQEGQACFKQYHKMLPFALRRH